MRWHYVSAAPEWPSGITNLKAKQSVAERLAQRLRDGDIVGAGSGSTSFLTLEALHTRAQDEHLQFTAIPTSVEVALACTSRGIPTTDLLKDRPDWSYDGADEVDPEHRMIKGRGGALFREKILMAASPEPYIVIDRTKLVDILGSHHPVPVEVDPFAVSLVLNEMRGYDAVLSATVRVGNGKDGPVITERGNMLIDLECQAVPEDMHTFLKLVPGVIETGIFQGYRFELVVAEE